MSRGLRNNNPGNIRHSAVHYQGEKISSDASFKQFTTIAYGYRALFMLLAHYIIQDGRNTIEKIMETYAPESENNTDGYIATVVKQSGVKRDEVLTDKSGIKLIKIVGAMSSVENAVPAIMTDVEAGFAMQNQITKK